MLGDLTEKDHKEPSNEPFSFKRLFKKMDAPTNNLELQQRNPLPSTSKAEEEQAICVRNAHKCYGTPRRPLTVLDGLNMTVPKGNIYALLGASGCGKTTLLSCILNQRTLNSGQIWILGGKPGSKASGVPGPRVGYMPQAVALYADFTIEETLFYYGWVLGLTSQKIQERFDFLKKLLLLPGTDQLVKCLSGGQQRRVSLASALLHEPELLILDEPTVGVDPLLRHTIWSHLVDLVQAGRTTIILTTHYIEEARQADIVGLMREGCLLAEEPPEKLILRFQAKTLEDVFLKLSVRQDKKRLPSIKEEEMTDVVVRVSDFSASDENASVNIEANPALSNINQQQNNSILEEDEQTNSLPQVPPENQFVSNCSDYLPNIKSHHLKALVWKGFLWMMRNIPAMLLVIMLPVTQIVVFCLAIGRDPTNLPVAVVNYETNNSRTCNNTLTCESAHLSCSYLGYLEKREINVEYYDSEELARESVLRGRTHASIVVRSNYSAALRMRIKKGEFTKPWDILASEIDVFRDVSNKHLATQLKVYLYNTFLNFVQDFVESCGANRKTLKIPINWEKPIYGVQHPNFTEFALPGILMILTFFLAVASTAFGMLIERNEGSFERTFVIGITEIELLIAHIICQFAIMASQAVMALVCAFVVLNMTLNGPVWLLAIYTLFTGFCGMCYGLLISCICDREQTAMYMAVGSVLPLLFLCGAIWPIEAVHPLLRPVAYFVPLTQGTEGLRSILQRGWSLDSPTVCFGLISLGLWAIIFLVISVILLKIKKNEVLYNVLPVLWDKCQQLFRRCKIKK